MRESWERSVLDKADGWPANSVGDQTLTRREAEVAALVSQGMANKVVAGKLGVVEGTVKIHLNKIYRKLRVSSRVGLILSAMADRRKLPGEKSQ
jgi:DNA-binding NarL/FixJ family response regulator